MKLPLGLRSSASLQAITQVQPTASVVHTLALDALAMPPETSSSIIAEGHTLNVTDSL